MTKATSGKRGYKICKNAKCQAQLHINQHICKTCNFNNRNTENSKAQINKKI